MEMNKDEAEKCLDLARKFRLRGDYDKAIKFFDKSLRLYPLPGVQQLKERVEEERAQQARAAAGGGPTAGGGGGGGSSSNSGSSGNGEARRRHQATGASAARGGAGPGGNGQAPSLSGRPYTEEQVVACRAILHAKRKGHYEVLSVTRTATDDEIKRSYRKLALRFHPDKNAAPEADEAFKAISTAFTTLSDPDKRRAYDQFGDEDGPAAAAARAHPFRHADVTPEEIFNMFFGMHGGGGGMGAGMGRGPGGFRVYRTHGGHPFGNRYQEDPRRQRGQGQGQGQGQQQQEHPLGVLGQLLQLLPVILLLFLSLFSFPAESDRPYSLHRTERHPVPRQTTAEHVYPDIPYFVSAKFERDYARDRRRLFNVEREVQQSYLYDLHRRCELERAEKARLLQTARRTFNREERQRRTEEAEAMAMPTCERWAGMVRGPPGGQG